ncbi:MAG: GNAT family N-acetyltransferase [Mobilitalea sp.]
MKLINKPEIKLIEKLDQKTYDLIDELQNECLSFERVALKLELDYKLAAAKEMEGKKERNVIDEFLCFNGEKLIGYIGICGFGGVGEQLEITGMVHPQYRRQGIFTELYQEVLKECRRRKVSNFLLLCDKESLPGQSFIKKINAVFKNSEFEMYLNKEIVFNEELLCGITFQKATNEDALEVEKQNRIYFSDHPSCLEAEGTDAAANSEDIQEELLLPEEEEKRGLLIYLAKKNGKIVGKVHLQVNTLVGGIYGVGVYPEYRGKGYGRAVLLFAVQEFKRRNVEQVVLQVSAVNPTALGLYQSCGFCITSTMDYYTVRVE